MKPTVHTRFKSAIDRLITDNIAKNKKEISESLGVSPSYFSGILNESIKINAEIIQTLLKSWPINPAWMFEVSDDFYTGGYGQELIIDRVEDRKEVYQPMPSKNSTLDCGSCEGKDKLISQQQATIVALQKALDLAEQRIQDLDKSK